MQEIDPFAPEFRMKKKRSDWSLGKRFRSLWVEDSYFEKKTNGSSDFAGGASHIGSSLYRRRIVLFSFVFFGLWSILILRLVYLQIIRGEEYRVLATNNSERIVRIPSERGLFFDRNNVQLVENVPSFSLYLVPADLPRNLKERESVIARAAELSGRSADEITGMIADYQAFSQDSIVIKEDIDYELALKLHVASTDIPSIFVARGSKRLYQGPISLSHVLGYIGKLDPDELKEKRSQGYAPSDKIGKTGIEQSYEWALRGTPGKRRIQVNARGKEQSVLAETSPEPGFQVQLSIDSAYQKKLEDIFFALLPKYGKSRASAVVTNPNTGEILALVSIPSFEANHFSGGISTSTYAAYLSNPDHPLYNRAISGTYPSGSTIKPVIASAALEEKIIDRVTAFVSNGGVRVGEWFFPDWNPAGHGITNVTKSLAWSVNTFYYYIGGGYGVFHGLGVDRIVGYLNRYGFGKILGIDIPGESPGFVPSKAWKEKEKGEPWYIGDTYNLSIGQGDLLVTPLQISSAIGAIANGGTLYRPRLVKTIINLVSGERRDLQSEIIRNNLGRQDSLEIVRNGMRECVVYGSCRQLAALPVMVAGKTGTAQWNRNKENHAWFTSFAPYDKPEITLTILVEEGGEGSSISVPIAREFYLWWWKSR